VAGGAGWPVAGAAARGAESVSGARGQRVARGLGGFSAGGDALADAGTHANHEYIVHVGLLGTGLRPLRGAGILTKSREWGFTTSYQVINKPALALA